MTWNNFVNTGPFTNNASPGISDTFLNRVEAFLDQFAGSVVTDSHISADGAGKITVLKLALTTGTLTRISHFTGTGSGAAQTVSHGLGATPDIVLLTYAGNFGSPPTHPPYWYNTTSTQVTIVADNAYFWHALAFAL